MPKISVMQICPMRSASTWLATNLQHNESIHFIPSSVIAIDKGGLSIADKKSMTINASPDKVIVGRRNLNHRTLNHNFGKAFHEYNRDLRFVGFLRNPIDRFFSTLRYLVNKYPVTKWPTSFQESVKRDKVGRITLSVDNVIHKELDLSLENRSAAMLVSDYSAIYGELLSYFERQQFCLVPLENDMRNISAAYETVANFITGEDGKKHKPLIDKVINQGNFITFKKRIKLMRFFDVVLEAPSDKSLALLKREFSAGSQRFDGAFGARTRELWGLTD